MSTQIAEFNIIGISVRTTNENGQAATDIPQLWAKFIGEGISGKIPGKVGEEIYCIYTHYEKDYTRPYTTILGCKVASIDVIPAGMTGLNIAASTYQQFTAKGNLNQGAVYNEWVKIWNSNIPRAYTADFEIYGGKSQNPEDAEVDIFIALQ